MGIKIGYSGSFIIPINALRDEQILMLQNHIEVTKKWLLNNPNNFLNLDCSEYNEWSIEVGDDCVFGFTMLDDGFDMEFFLKEILKLNSKYVFFLNKNYSSSCDLDLDKLNKEIFIEERKDKLNKIETNKNI